MEWHTDICAYILGLLGQLAQIGYGVIYECNTDLATYTQWNCKV